MRYRISIVPPGTRRPPPLHMLPGDSVHTTVVHNGLVWESTWTATEITTLDFTYWEEVVDE